MVNNVAKLFKFYSNVVCTVLKTRIDFIDPQGKLLGHSSSVAHKTH